MKKVFSILVGVVLIASGMHISIDRHYCGGTLADVKVSVTGKLASCGMEPSRSDCGNHPALSQKCCEDQLSFIITSSNYCPEYNNIIYKVSEKDIFNMMGVSPISYNYYHNIPDNWVMPPGDPPCKNLTQNDICVFRI